MIHFYDIVYDEDGKPLRFTKSCRQRLERENLALLEWAVGDKYTKDELVTKVKKNIDAYEKHMLQLL